VPIAVFLILAAALLIFRTLHGMALLLTSILAAVIWSMGVFPLFGRPIDMICSTLSATLLVYGAVDPIFVLTRFMSKLRAGLGRDDAIVAAFEELLLPCCLTSVTTALGFACFATLRLPTLVVFGSVTAIGVLFSFVATMTVLPLLLGSLAAPPVRERPLRLLAWLDRVLVRAAAVIRARRGLIIALAAALLVAGGLASLRQTVSVTYVGTLPAGATRDTVNQLEHELSGVTRTAILLSGPPGTMKRPEVLRAIAAIDAEAERHPIVTSSLSLADLVEEMNQAFEGGAPAAHAIPAAQALIAQYLTLLDPRDRADFVDDDLSTTHIRVYTEDHGSVAWRALDADLHAAVDRNLRGLGVTATFTGFAPTLFPVVDGLVYQMLLGFALGFGMIVLLELIIFRSWRIALISAVPNLLPAVASFVLLSVTGTTLRIGTVLFCSTSIGGLFNTTIHFAARVVQRVRAGDRDPDQVIEHAMRSVIPPSLFTAGILSLGFATFLLSRFPDLVVFGAFSMSVLLFGFFADAVVTPALFRRFYVWPSPIGTLGTKENS
jgi:predicted RND superfamily exporter protein